MVIATNLSQMIGMKRFKIIKTQIALKSYSFSRIKVVLRTINKS
jgi:hypothetical protein